MSAQSRRLLLFGAGGIGLSFVAQLFRRAEYTVTVADVDQRSLDQIRAWDGYVIEAFHPNGEREEISIKGIETVRATDESAIRSLLADGPQPPIIATAVGLRAFGIVLGNLAEWAPADRPITSFDLIAAENIHDPRALAEELVGQHAPSVHACAVGKMVPRRSQEDRERGALPLVIRCEAFNTLYVDGAHWRGPMPTGVAGLELVDPIEAWMDRKLFVHNLGHGACAWIARAHDSSLTTIAEAISLPSIRDRVQEVMEHAATIVLRKWDGVFDQESLQEHVEDLLARFASPLLNDSVERVGQDIARKAGRDERLVGCMRLAASVAPDSLDVLARLWNDALAFGVEGVSQNDSDVSIANNRSRDRSFVEEMTALDPSESHERLVLDRLSNR